RTGVGVGAPAAEGSASVTLFCGGGTDAATPKAGAGTPVGTLGPLGPAGPAAPAAPDGPALAIPRARSLWTCSGCGASAGAAAPPLEVWVKLVVRAEAIKRKRDRKSVV